MSIEKNGSPIRRPNAADYDQLMKRTGHYSMSPASYRNMLDNIHLHCEVEAEHTQQYGEVVEIIRDKYGIPACLKVIYETKDGRWGYDYISPEAVTLYEPYSSYCPDDEYEEDCWGQEDDF